MVVAVSIAMVRIDLAVDVFELLLLIIVIDVVFVFDFVDAVSDIGPNAEADGPGPLNHGNELGT